jgi:FkbM family methyltransferase
MIRSLLIEARRRVLRTYRRWRQPRVIRHAGVLLAIDRHVPPEILEFLYAGDYERSELKPLRKHLRPDDVVMELGAGIGFISLQCAKRIGPDRVFSFEANPGLEPYIRRNYQLNRLYPQLEICVLGQGHGETDFYVHDQFWASTTVPGTDGTRSIRVPVRPLNEEIRRIDPTFLVLDIEGGESELFRFIDFHQIQKIALELHTGLIGHEAAAMIKRRLRDAGFSWEEGSVGGGMEHLCAWRAPSRSLASRGLGQ